MRLRFNLADAGSSPANQSGFLDGHPKANAWLGIIDCQSVIYNFENRKTLIFYQIRSPNKYPLYLS
jgi:hypothetical protein